MKKTKTWLVVADGARAQIFVNEGPGRGLQPALGYELASSKAPTRARGTDKPGRSGDRAGGSGHAVEPRIDLHQDAKMRFAAETAAVLDQAAAEGAFDRLVLVAPPKMLGALRGALKNGARDRIAGELGKDLTHVPVQDLAGHLGGVMVI